MSIHAHSLADVRDIYQNFTFTVPWGIFFFTVSGGLDNLTKLQACLHPVVKPSWPNKTLLYHFPIFHCIVTNGNCLLWWFWQPNCCFKEGIGTPSSWFCGVPNQVFSGGISNIVTGNKGSCFKKKHNLILILTKWFCVKPNQASSTEMWSFHVKNVRKQSFNISVVCSKVRCQHWILLTGSNLSERVRAQI